MRVDLHDPTLGHPVDPVGAAVSLARAAQLGWSRPLESAADGERWELDAATTTAVLALDLTGRRRVLEGAHDLLAVFTDPVSRTDRLNRLLGQPTVRVVLSGDRPALGLVGRGREADRLLAISALALASLLTEHGPEALCTCAWTSCSRPMVWVGRRASDTWCSERCANRGRVARHRARRRAEAASAPVAATGIGA
jgi:predicted RNA-binding Zn ribbon-like protein